MKLQNVARSGFQSNHCIEVKKRKARDLQDWCRLNVSGLWNSVTQEKGIVYFYFANDREAELFKKEADTLKKETAQKKAA